MSISPHLRPYIMLLPMYQVRPNGRSSANVLLRKGETFLGCVEEGFRC